MNEVWIIDTCRTPRGVGKRGKGALTGFHPQQLGSAVLKALAERNNIKTAEIDDIIWGTSSQRGQQSGCLGRMAALGAGYDVRASAITIDRFCGSGISAVSMATGAIASGMEDLVIAGGTEQMSNYGIEGNGQATFMDNGNLQLRALHPQPHQGICADAIATLEGIDRQALDQLAVVSQQRAAHAIANGHFKKSLVPVYHLDGTLALDKEEFPRPSTTLETLSQLKPAFTDMIDMPLDEQGTTNRKLLQSEISRPEPAITCTTRVTRRVWSMAPQRCLMCSPEYAKKQGWKPRARIVAMANMGDCPTLDAERAGSRNAQSAGESGLTLDDIDLFEINEAFAVVAEKFIRDLKLDRNKVNVNGGAMALGHPIGATGSILIGTVLDELERRELKRGLVTMCAAGGMAPAIIIERM